MVALVILFAAWLVPTHAASTPQWEVVSTAHKAVIGSAEAVPHGIYQGFETGFYFKVNDTYYYSATELGLCKGIIWDHTTRAGVHRCAYVHDFVDGRIFMCIYDRFNMDRSIKWVRNVCMDMHLYR